MLGVDITVEAADPAHKAAFLYHPEGAVAVKGHPAVHPRVVLIGLVPCIFAGSGQEHLAEVQFLFLAVDAQRALALQDNVQMVPRSAGGVLLVPRQTMLHPAVHKVKVFGQSLLVYDTSVFVCFDRHDIICLNNHLRQ